MTKTHRVDVITIIVIGLLAFGLQIPWLGFFQDDWNFVFMSSARGLRGLLDYLIIDGRPGAVWVYALGFGVLGYRTALWQAFSLLLRVLTTLNFWMILNSLWPTRRYGNLVASIFFLTYPFFTLQPLSVAYAPHFMAYFLYSLSILLMIRALEKPEKYLLFSIPAILSMFIHLFTVEYFAGLELLRPLVLWFLISRRENLAWRATLRKVFTLWLPYLLTLIFFALWRSAFSMSTGVRNNPLGMLFNSGQIVSIVKNMFADFVLMFISSWFKLIDPELFVIGPARNLYLFAIIFLGALCFYFLAKAVQRGEETESRSLKGILLAGALIVAAGMLSTYAADFIVHLKNPLWNSRFSLPILLGMALLASGLIEAVITSKKTQHIFLAILVGLLIGWHNQNTLDFKVAWERQSRFYQQLMWRAPSINPDTALVANEEILGYMGDRATIFGINTMYESKQIDDTPYWFFALSENFNSSASPITSGGPLDAQKVNVGFHGNGKNAIFITYQQQCLWVLRPQDSEYKFLPPEMKKGALVSNYENILPQEKEHSLYREIVRENKDTWCYFYQKADLARQTQDWGTVITLWNEAQNRGYRPDEGFEFIPFIEAYAHAGKWEDAFLLTKNANKTTQAMYFILCPTWERFTQETGPSAQKDLFVKKAYNLLNCVP